MKTSLLGLTVLVLVNCLLGCSSNSDGASSSSSDGVDGTPLACNDAVDHFCMAYGAVADGERQDNTYCEPENVVPSCATTDLRATCAYSNGLTGNSAIYWYTDSTATDHDIQFACDQSEGTLTMN